jgi:hypothetical protein
MFRTASLAAALLAGMLGVLVAWVHETERARSVGRGTDSARNRIERCLTCHDKPREDPGGAHASAALGCSTCHLGNPMAFEKRRAHEGLEREPGVLATVNRTCGREGCHAREAASVSSSLMARGSGIVGVDRWVFGEAASPDSSRTMDEALQARRPSLAESHLTRLCAGCHLGTRRANRDDAISGNGSGCSACHVPPRIPEGLRRPHPPVDARVGDERCLGCHSKSGRISLSYAGLREVTPEQARAGIEPCREPVTLPGGRPGCRSDPDVHRAAGISCIDCHLHSDVMGDGRARSHQEEQVEVTCESCHGAPRGRAETEWGSVADPITKDLLRERHEERSATEPVRIGRRGTPLWNVQRSGSGWFLARKLGGKPLPVRRTPEDANHRMKGHERLSCSSCHAAAAPTCSSCHTRLEADQEQWDFASAGPARGAWSEHADGFAFQAPALGVTAENRIVPAIPGMILTLDSPGSAAAKRFFAPIEPHTTGKRARTCESCHRSPVALGLGTGTLSFDGANAAFQPRARAASDPRLAADGWTTLFPQSPGAGTRVGFRSLDANEQRRILVVGSCLSCHRSGGDPIWKDFRRSLARLSKPSRCKFGFRGVSLTSQARNAAFQ